MLTDYPRHQYALISGQVISRIIRRPEDEEPEVWKESPADLVATYPLTGEEAGELKTALDEANAYAVDHEPLVDAPSDDGSEDTLVGEAHESEEAVETVNVPAPIGETIEIPDFTPRVTVKDGEPFTPEPTPTVRFPITPEPIGGTPASRKAAKQARKAAKLKAQEPASSPDSETSPPDPGSI